MFRKDKNKPVFTGVGFPNPANELGSPESRAAARAMLNRSNVVTCVVIMTGLPSPFRGQRPTVVPPDSIAYYRAADDSLVSVISREYEPAKFTAFIEQTWKDGIDYHGDRRVESLFELEKISKLDSRSAEAMLYAQP